MAAALTSQHSRLQDGKPYKQQHQLESMQLPRVPAQAFCTSSFTTVDAVHTSTGHTPATASSLYVLNDTPSHSNKPGTGVGGSGERVHSIT
jgi:hypothetical protein